MGIGSVCVCCGGGEGGAQHVYQPFLIYLIAVAVILVIQLDGLGRSYFGRGLLVFFWW